MNRYSHSLLPCLLALTWALLAGCSSGTGVDTGIVSGSGTGSDVELNDLPDASLGQDAFLAQNAQRDRVTVTESGLQYEVLQASDGARPGRDATVTVHYRGTLINGTEFDSSHARGHPATFLLSNTIKGWVEGVQLMNVGSRFRFVIPPELAYGEAGAGSVIKPGDALIFVVDLLEINAT